MFPTPCMATTLGIEPFLLQLLKRLAVPLGAEQPRGRSANIGTRPRLVKREVVRVRLEAPWC